MNIEKTTTSVQFQPDVSFFCSAHGCATNSDEQFMKTVKGWEENGTHTEHCSHDTKSYKCYFRYYCYEVTLVYLFDSLSRLTHNLFPWLCIAILPLSTPSSCFVSIRIITYDELLHAEILWNLLNSCFSLSSKLLKMARQQFLTMKLCCSSLEKIIISFYVFQPWAGGILQTKKKNRETNHFESIPKFFSVFRLQKLALHN